MKIASRLSTANWPFALKFAVPCIMVLLLLVFVEVKALSAIDALNADLQDLSQNKFIASNQIANTVQELSDANGQLLQMQINQAAGVTQNVTEQTKKINDLLDTILAELDLFKSKFASGSDIAKIDSAITNIKGYKEAVSFVGSMLDVDFKATVNFLTPLAKAREATLKELKEVSETFLVASQDRAKGAVNAVAERKKMLYAISITALLLTMLATIAIVISTINSVKLVAEATRKVADGDTNIDVAALARKDELGEIVVALRTFCENVSKMNAMKAEQEAIERRAAQQKTEALNTLASNFEASVGHIVRSVAAAATELQANAEGLATSADQTSRLSNTVSTATDEASSSVQTVASAAEELSASIGEINHQVDESTKVAANAVDEVKHTDVTVSSLSEAAAQIGDVVKLIQDIAGQTNLLALNATIEAARAGEAGKGFAVVASEVKNLASQTARATEEISGKIQTVQNASVEAVNAIRSIGQTIERISEVSSIISNAVQQQNAATREISSNVQKAFDSTSRVSHDISSVTEAASDSKRASNEVLQASGQLSQQSELLRKEIDAFVSNLKSG